MNRPSDSQQPAKSTGRQPESVKEAPQGVKTYYLIAYNLVSALLWLVVLGRTVLIAGTHGPSSVYYGVGHFTKWTQTLAALEVVHSLIGIVRAPVLTTAMQVASRFLLVWGIVDNFPNTTSASPAYTSMLLAWSVTEVVRYSFFAVSLAYGRVPALLLWLRYNAFFVLYPLGISSECWLVWLTVPPARSWNAAYEWVLKLILLIYVPGSYILFTHMMSQRKKVMRGQREKKTH